jgi:hypothetical protein
MMHMNRWVHDPLDPSPGCSWASGPGLSKTGGRRAPACGPWAAFAVRSRACGLKSPTMTRERSWQVEGVTRILLRQVESLGYTVSVHRIPSSLLGSVGAFVEMHAVGLRADPPVQQMARVGLDEVVDAESRCACLLAEAVGIHLDDG